MFVSFCRENSILIVTNLYVWLIRLFLNGRSEASGRRPGFENPAMHGSCGSVKHNVSVCVYVCFTEHSCALDLSCKAPLAFIYLTGALYWSTHKWAWLSAAVCVCFVRDQLCLMSTVCMSGSILGFIRGVKVRFRYEPAVFSLEHRISRWMKKNTFPWWNIWCPWKPSRYIYGKLFVVHFHNRCPTAKHS